MHDKTKAKYIFTKINGCDILIEINKYLNIVSMEKKEEHLLVLKPVFSCNFIELARTVKSD
jgi:hypothetical protein